MNAASYWPNWQQEEHSCPESFPVGLRRLQKLVRDEPFFGVDRTPGPGWDFFFKNMAGYHVVDTTPSPGWEVPIKDRPKDVQHRSRYSTRSWDTWQDGSYIRTLYLSLGENTRCPR